MKNRTELKARDLKLLPDSRAILRGNDLRNGEHPVCLFQPRALKALEMCLAIPDMEYNIYVAGDPGLGRTFLVENFLAARAGNGETPPDLVYLNNFRSPDNPILVHLPPGRGKVLKEKLRDVTFSWARVSFFTVIGLFS